MKTLYKFSQKQFINSKLC